MTAGANHNYRGGILGIYPRKLLFFACIAIIATAAGYYIRTNYFQADTLNSVPVDDATSGETIHAVVADNGSITVDGEESSWKFNLVDSADELRVVALENPNEYIDEFNLELTLPASIAYGGEYEILAIHGVDSSRAYAKDAKTIVYTASGISPYAIISIVAKLPKGTIKHPFYSGIFERVGELKFDHWLVLAAVLPLFTLIFLIAFLAYQTRLHKIDQPDKEVTSPPMAIPPALVGALYHQKVGPRELAATLIDLARRKDIYILDRERGFAFGKGKFDSRLLGYEKMLLSKIFRNNLTSERLEIEKRISNHLYSKKMSVVSAGIYAIATRLGYFRVNPSKVHAKYRLIGILALMLGLGGFLATLIVPSLPGASIFLWLGMMVAALIIAFTAGNIPLRTEIGKEALSNWLAFRKFLTNPKPISYTPSVYALFEEYLPYAMVLDCESAWAKRFEEHNFIVPEWFMTDRVGLGLDDFCLSLFPIISYVARGFAQLREPGFE
jgi:hypothetical protein